MSRYNIETNLNILLSRDLEFHHIDLDRTNNELENLIVLPRKIHRKLHQIIKQDARYSNTRKEVRTYLRRNNITKLFLGEISRKAWVKKKHKTNI